MRGGVLSGFFWEGGGVCWGIMFRFGTPVVAFDYQLAQQDVRGEGGG